MYVCVCVCVCVCEGWGGGVGGGGGLSDKREEEKTTGTLRPLISRAPQTNGHLVGEKKNKSKRIVGR